MGSRTSTLFKLPAASRTLSWMLLSVGVLLLGCNPEPSPKAKRYARPEHTSARPWSPDKEGRISNDPPNLSPVPKVVHLRTSESFADHLGARVQVVGTLHTLDDRSHLILESGEQLALTSLPTSLSAADFEGRLVTIEARLESHLDARDEPVYELLDPAYHCEGDDPFCHAP